MTTAGYSGTPLPKKLGIKPGARVLAIRAPESLDDMFESLDDVVVSRDRVAAADVSIVFVTRAADMSRWLGRLEPHLVRGARLWVAWPKKASKVPTDLTFDVVQTEGLGLGLVDTKICAIDDVWTGLCFMRRVK